MQTPMEEDKIRILVVEDDETLCDTLQFNLELEGYVVDKAYCAEDALKYVNGHDGELPSLVLLDVMMGEMSGFSFARLMKANPGTSDIPIIFCTAKDSEDDMVAGLNLGADDYIFKPYTIRNVLTRVQAVLRRTASHVPKSDVVRFEGIELDRGVKSCKVDGKEVKLVKKEFEILCWLILHRGRIFTRDEILRTVWDDEVVVGDRTVDVNITRIRQKIAPYGGHIITRSGYGYGFI